MCLNLRKDYTTSPWFGKNVLVTGTKAMKSKSAIAYKILRRGFGRKTLVGQYFGHHQWRAGLNKSDRKNKKVTRNEQLNGSVNHGIHVIMKRKTALKRLAQTGTSQFQYRLVPVKVLRRNLVTLGPRDEAVFASVRMSERAFRNATR